MYTYIHTRQYNTDIDTDTNIDTNTMQRNAIHIQTASPAGMHTYIHIIWKTPSRAQAIRITSGPVLSFMHRVTRQWLSPFSLDSPASPKYQTRPSLRMSGWNFREVLQMIDVIHQPGNVPSNTTTSFRCVLIPKALQAPSVTSKCPVGSSSNTTSASWCTWTFRAFTLYTTLPVL